MAVKWAKRIEWGKRSWPLIILSVLTLAYAVVDYVYYMQNDVHLTWHEIIIVSNLHGFESTVGEIIAPVWYVFAVEVLVWAAFMVIYWRMAERWRRWLNIGLWTAYACLLLMMIGLEIPRPLTDREHRILAEVDLPLDTIQPSPIGHTVLILGESWESWALEAHDKDGHPVCPHILHYIHTHPTLYVRQVECQKRHGVSGDGQLIVHSGLLPLQYGVASMTRPNDARPSFVQHYPNAVLINEDDAYWCWQQTAPQYGYTMLDRLEGDIFHCNDSLLLDRLMADIQRVDTPTFFGVYTISTHDPFKQHTAQVDLGDEYTDREKRYLNCCAFSDRQIGRFLAWADTAAVMHDARIIFASDHNIFCKSATRGKCIFWMSSPSIRESRHLENALQMDIYPTIVCDMGIRGGWRGLGIDLMDSTATRRITAEEAQILSDKLIRDDYFDGRGAASTRR